MIALERGSRGSLHPVVYVRLLNRSDDEEAYRVRTWLVTGTDIQTGLARGFARALEQWRMEGESASSSGVAKG